MLHKTEHFGGIMATCVNGHSSPDGAKFCGTCGGAMAAGSTAPNAAGGVTPPAGGFRSTMKLSGSSPTGAPSGGYVPPASGYTPPSGGYVPPSGGYVPPSGGYVPPAGGYVPAGPAATGSPTKGLSISSMVLGICGVVFAFCYYPIGFLCAVVGVVLGGVALSKMNSGGDRSGRGMAIAGLVCSIVAIGIGVLALIFWGSVIAAMNNSSY